MAAERWSGEERSTAANVALGVLAFVLTAALWLLKGVLFSTNENTGAASQVQVAAPAPVASDRVHDEDAGRAEPLAGEEAMGRVVQVAPHHRAAHGAHLPPGGPHRCHGSNGAVIEIPAGQPCSSVGADEGSGVSEPREHTPRPSVAPSHSGSYGPVQVRGYYRRDGTYVHGYSRRR